MALILDATGSNTANVNGDSELQVALSKVSTKAGYATLLGERHDGAIGMSARRQAPWVSPARKLAVGADTLLWDDSFPHTIFNTSKYWSVSQAAMNVGVAGGALILNSTGLTTSGAAAIVRTYRTFPLLANAPTVIDFAFSLALQPQLLNVAEIGFGIPNASGNAVTPDGVYMQIDSAGALQLVAAFNGSFTTSGPITLPPALAWIANRTYHGKIVLLADSAELYLDDVLVGAVARSAANAAGSLSLAQCSHLFARLHNISLTTGGQKLNVLRWSVTNGDLATNRSLAATRTTMGDHALSIPDGTGVGPLANIVNSTAPVSAALSNTAAGYATLGGNFQFAAVAGAETDYALFAYQVPQPFANTTTKNFMLTGIDISAFNMGAAVAVTPTLLNWYLGIGSTAVSLATADSTNARAPRKRWLGNQAFPVGAGIGATADRDIRVEVADTPLPVEPGTFVHIILRMPVGTATAAQIIRGSVNIKGYWE
jgi:hypothetical protein